MSDIDLTPVVEAVARGRWERTAPPQITWEMVPPATKHLVREQVDLPDLLTAVGEIAAQVREQIARVIEAEAAAARDRYQLSGVEGDGGRVLGLHRAAKIARGVKS